MDLGELELFVEVSRCGGLGRAARALFVSQPAATGRLHNLEHELGITLFERSNRGMSLSEAGRAFLPYAERIIRTAREGRAFVRHPNSGFTTVLRIGSSLHAGLYVLPEMLSRARYRGATVRTAHSVEITEWVLKRDVDLGLVSEVSDSRLQGFLLFQEPVVVAVAPRHHLASKSQITPQHLEEVGLISWGSRGVFERFAQKLLDTTGIVPHVAANVETAEIARALAEAGFGVAAVPTSAAAHALSSGALVALDVSGFDPDPIRCFAIIDPRWDNERALDFLGRAGHAVALERSPRPTDS